MSECQTKAGNQECFEKLSILLLLSLLSLLSLISLLSLFHSLYLDMLNNFCFYVYAQKSLSHSFTFTTFTTSFTLSRHAEQLLFSCLCSKSLSHSFTFTTFATFTTFTLSFTQSRHAEQLLFSCLCSKVPVYSRKLQCFFRHPPHPIS